MKKLSAAVFVLLMSGFAMAQTSFTTENISAALCKTWRIDFSVMDGVTTAAANDSVMQNSTMQFFTDNTFVFFMGDEQLFGRWSFYPSDQSVFIDFSTDHLFDQNFALKKLTDTEMNYTASYYNISKKTWEVHLVPNETN